MEWRIIGRDGKTLCVSSDEIEDSLPIDDSSGQGQCITLSNRILVETYDFETVADHKDSQYITSGNFILFKDKYDKIKRYMIRDVDGDYELSVHCENLDIDMTNAEAEPWDFTGTIAETLALFLPENYVIGVNEIPDKITTTQFEQLTDTKLSRLGGVLEEFNVEGDIEIRTANGKVLQFVLNIRRHVGSKVAVQRFVSGVNLDTLNTKSDLDGFSTAIRPYGNKDIDGNVTDIKSVTYDDGRYYSPAGDHIIYDRQGKEEWGKYNPDGSLIGEKQGYIVRNYEYETSDPNVLLQKALATLKRRNSKHISYEAKFDGIIACCGDVVQIADFTSKEPLFLSSRINTVNNYYTVNGQDMGIIGTYRTLKSKYPSIIENAINQTLANRNVIYKIETFYQVGLSQTVPPEGHWESTIPAFDTGFLWTKTIHYYSNGTSETAYTVSAAVADNSLFVDLSSYSVIVPVDNFGRVTDYSNASFQISVFHGKIDVTDVAVISFLTKNVSGNYDKEKNFYTISDLAADSGMVEIKVEYSGNTVNKTFVISKSIGGINGKN